MKKLVIFLLAVVFSTVAACGTTQPEKPAVGADETAECIASIYLDSDLSHEYLVKYVAGYLAGHPLNFVFDDDEARTLKEVKAKIKRECTGGLSFLNPHNKENR